MKQLILLENLKAKATELIKKSKYQKAVFIGKQILQINSKCIEGFYVLAICYMQLGQYEKSIKIVNKIIAIDANYMGAYIVLAHIHKRRYQLEEEIDVLNFIVKFLGDKKSSGFSLQEVQIYSEACSLLGSAFTLLGEHKKASQYFLLSSQIEQGLEQKIIDYSNYLFVLNYDNQISSKDIYIEHLKYNKFFYGVNHYEHCKRPLGEKIRIGYISPDFRDHAVVFFCYNLLANFNKQEFTVNCYSLSNEDSVTLILKRLVPKWHNLSKMSADEAARIIYEDKIDILIDLSGHTAHNALPILARKPAPIQVSGIGYFNTTGLKEVDYFLTDIYCDPVGQNDEYFSEKLIRLPYSHFCYKPYDNMPNCSDTPYLKNHYITFGSFNNFNKVTEHTLKVWSKILIRVPRAKLILKSKIFSSKYGREIAVKRLQQAGIEKTRVEFREFTVEYLAEYNDIDIALDTFPYPGGATTCEALYMGVPVVSLIGNRHGARFGFSLLKNIELEELAAYDEAEYVEKAVSLAMDVELLQEFHKKLRSIMQHSSLMNVNQYIESVEIAYKDIWLNWQKKNYPLVSILIPTFNRPQYFQVALESALQQTYSNIEIIICDNSTDNRTELLIEQYKHDRRIRYMRNREAKTKEANFLPFEYLVKGEYIQWLMDDDVLKPEKIEIMMKCFADNPDVTLVTSCRRWIDQAGNEIVGIKKIKFNEPNTIISGRSLGKAMLLNMSNLIGEPSAFLFRKKDLLHHYWTAECKGYKRISDVVMGLELLEKGNCGYFSDALSSYRWHSEQEGQQPDVIIQSRLEWLNIIKEYYYKQCFIDNIDEYDKSLHHWLNDANDVLTKLCEESINNVLLIKYKEKIIDVNQYLSKRIT